ncbi:hypothetical protein L7F22_054823 [Adiantum nelumboides]|nr:hypothetical protein [Adiantum nelumboides]
MSSCCSQQRLASYVSVSPLPCAHYNQQDDQYFTSTQLINAASSLNFCDNQLDQDPFLINDKSPLWTAPDTNNHQSKLNDVDANCGHLDFAPAFDSFEQMYKDNYTQLLDIVTQFGAGSSSSNTASDLDHDAKLYDYIDVSASTQTEAPLSLAQAEASGWRSTATNGAALQRQQYEQELGYCSSCTLTDAVNAEEVAWPMNAAGPLTEGQKDEMMRMMTIMMGSDALNGAVAGGHDCQLQNVCCNRVAESSDDMMSTSIYRSALMTNMESSINITDEGHRAGLLIERDITSHIVVKREEEDCGRMNELPAISSSDKSMRSMTPSRKRGRQFVPGQRKRFAGASEGHGSAATDKHHDDDVVLVRARRGQATDSHSLAERVRREKIRQRMKLLQELVPGSTKVLGKAAVLEEIINYVRSLQHQIDFLSMKLAANTANSQQRFHF